MTTPHITEDDDAHLRKWPDEHSQLLALDQQNTELIRAVEQAWTDARELLNRAEEMQDQMQSIWDDLSSCMIKLRFQQRQSERAYYARKRGKESADEQ